MVHCMIRSHNQQYKITRHGDDAENMCGATLEPDPRYQECCSNVCRPGKVLRDLIIGLLVVLAIAVVIAVLFVLCYYLITPETEETVVGGESAFLGKPIENEKNPNVLNEVEFTDNTRYDVRPDVVLEGIRKENDETAHDHGRTDHVEHHHMGPTPTTESVPEPEPESEPEPSAEPEPEPGKDQHDHMHKEGDMGHDHMHKEGDMGHDHMHKEGDMGHDHMHEGDMGHDHVHLDGDMDHEHEHPSDGMDHMHPHSETGRMHPDDAIHMHKEGDMDHEMMHKEVGITQEAGITHEEGNVHDHIHTNGQEHHEHMGEEHMGPKHTVDHDATGPLFFPTAPVNDEVFEVVRSPSFETVPSVTPSERTVVSVSSATGPGAKVQIHSSESESIITPATVLDNFGEIRESSGIPPLFDNLGFRPNATIVIPSSEVFPEVHTEFPLENQPEESPIAIAGPLAPVEEVDAPIFAAEEPAVTEVVPAGSCRPRRLEMCKDLPYGLTSLPNWANDQNEQELNEASLPFFRDVIVRSGCSPRARQYACGILEPPCKSDGSIIPPCRTFCRSVAATCKEFVISGFSLSNVFDCDRFPDSSDPSVCFDMTQEPCVGREHRCGDGRCVARRLVCDGIPDCLDQSDEATCPNRVSGFSRSPATTSAAPAIEPQTSFPGEEISVTIFPEEAFESTTTEPLVEETTIFAADPVTSSVCPELQCLDGTCLAVSQLNDGVNDCSDGTDELDFGLALG